LTWPGSGSGPCPPDAPASRSPTSPAAPGGKTRQRSNPGWPEGSASGPPAQGACACANICEHCPSFRTDTGYLPVLAAQRTDAEQLARDAQERGWITEADRHRKLIARLDDLIARAQAG
jgi:hypothetical protein